MAMGFYKAGVDFFSGSVYHFRTFSGKARLDLSDFSVIHQNIRHIRLPVNCVVNSSVSN